MSSFSAGTLLTRIVGQRVGRPHNGAIFGRMISFMVIGEANGAPLLGMIRDATGSYAPALGNVVLTDAVAIRCITGFTPPAQARVNPAEKRGSEGGGG